MDRSRYVRPATQRQTQITKNTLESAQPVPRTSSLRPQSLAVPVKNSNYPGLVALRNSQINSDIVSQRQDDIRPMPKFEQVQQDNGIGAAQQAHAEIDSQAIKESLNRPESTQAALLARYSPIDMSLPDEENPSSIKGFFSRTRSRKARLIAIRSFAVVLVLVITLSGLLFSQSYLKLHKVFRGSAATAAALKPNVNPNLLKGENTGRVNVLLLGRDGGNHSNPDLTDTMMLASIDPVNNTAVLLSIPSDLWVNVPGAGVMKINAAWENGEFKFTGKNTSGSTDPNAVSAGFNIVDQTVSQVMGVKINYNALVNLSAFEQAVTTVGGVSVNVPSSLTDSTMAWQNGGNPVLASAGTQTLNGKQAQLYITSKETSSDSARAERQREVLMSLINKIVSLNTIGNPLKVSSLINTFGNNIATDLSTNDAGRLFSIIKNINGNNISSLDLITSPNKLVTTGNMNGQAIVLPSTGLFSYADIQQFVTLQLKNPYVIKENAKILVLNGTDYAGLATATGDKLKTSGYNVVGEANTPSSGWPKTSLFDLTKSNPYTKHFLEERYRLSFSKTLPNKTIPTDGADFVIIIGNDEANTTQTQAH